MGIRLKWVAASYISSLERDKQFTRVDVLRGMWTAFWLAPELEEESDVWEFLTKYT